MPSKAFRGVGKGVESGTRATSIGVATLSHSHKSCLAPANKKAPSKKPARSNAVSGLETALGVRRIAYKLTVNW